MGVTMVLMSSSIIARMMYHDTKTRLPFLLTVWCQNGGEVVVDDASVAKMSGSDVGVEPYLNKRNTIGHGTATQILKARSGKTCRDAKQVSNGGGMRKW
mgnify:CR=1 FL=1